MRNSPLTESETPVTETRYSQDHWRIVRCEVTGMVFLANPPDYESLAEDFAWEKTYVLENRRRRESEPAFSAVSSAVKMLRRTVRPRERIETLSAAVLARMARPTDRAPLLVDVGCGTGDKAVAIVELIKSRSQESPVPVGIEISSEQAAVADQNLRAYGGRCLRCSALDGMESIADGSADLIILCSFLEHEVNPLPLLRACGRALAREGRIIIKVPNYASLNRHVRQKRWCGFRFPDHVNYFTPRTLKMAIERADLCLIRMNAYDRQPTSDNMWAIAGKPS